MSGKLVALVLAVALLVSLFLPVMTPDAASADTSIGGQITSNTTWTKANSPYIVTSNILVPQGVILTIEPGVIVKFNSSKLMQIDGCLIARGTEVEPIVFTSAQASPAPGDWAGIMFTNSSVDAIYDAEGNYVSGSLMQYCTVEYGGGNNNPALKTVSSSLFIDHCTISNNACRGVRVDNGSTMITNNTITNNSDSGIYTYGATVTISGNTFSNNSASDKGGGIFISGGIVTISGNIIMLFKLQK